jgi:ABC-type transport system involved in multi-copper enzyme maturation permease subunit
VLGSTVPPEEVANNEIIPNIKRKRRVSSVQEGATRQVGDSPVLWREMRQSAFRTKTVLFVALAFVVGLVAWLYYYVGFDEEGLHIGIAITATITMLIAGAVTATSVVTGERESRTWEVLLTTPLTAWDIVFGKAAGAVRRQWFIPVLLALHLGVAVFIGMFQYRGLSASAFLWAALLLIPPVLLLSATGTLFSLVSRKSTAAATLNFGLALALWAGVPAFSGWVLFNLNRGSEFNRDIFSVLMVMNPVGMIVQAMDGSFGTDSYSLYSFSRVGAGGFLTACSASALIYLLATWATLRLAGSILAAQTARAK